MSVPLYQAKAEMFRTLGHPVRIRVLELLQDGPKPVRHLLSEIDVEASNLSQQLAVLRRAGIVLTYRDGPLVMYALSTPDVALAARQDSAGAPLAASRRSRFRGGRGRAREFRRGRGERGGSRSPSGPAPPEPPTAHAG
ncbi:ArsR/SmtB family transcription factor [Catenuloplanes japonicus]|uniref:ArsR/SmtB family transcription factor n=1 Tax=Catenuloplanes japonicus TaxID=33876 RepID=UPI000A10FAB7|nr:metalloregulator ArsR/SmtB family transcription factor [Catenuloplanes japonicus]